MSELDRMIPFRMSTLSDPLQPCELSLKYSLGILRLAYEYSIPLILNTKSNLITVDPWFKVVSEMACENLILVQLTLITLDDSLRRVLEPNAPSVNDRLRVLDVLSSSDIPIILRLQPIIPYVNDNLDFLEEYFDMARSLNILQVIVEFLRHEPSWINLLYRRLNLGFKPFNCWVRYDSRGVIVHPSLDYRVNVGSKLLGLSERYKIPVAFCKEGLFLYETPFDCCGFRYLSKSAFRVTLKEYVKSGSKSFEDFIRGMERRREYHCGYKVRFYPRILRKGLRTHERVLSNIIANNRYHIFGGQHLVIKV